MTRQSLARRRANWRPGSDYNMTAAEAAEFLGLSTRKLAQLRQQGRGRLYVSVRRRNWYSLAELIVFHKFNKAISDPGIPKKISSDGR
jgi:hypothetical protein